MILMIPSQISNKSVLFQTSRKAGWGAEWQIETLWHPKCDPTRVTLQGMLGDSGYEIQNAHNTNAVAHGCFDQ